MFYNALSAVTDGRCLHLRRLYTHKHFFIITVPLTTRGNVTISPAPFYPRICYEAPRPLLKPPRVPAVVRCSVPLAPCHIGQLELVKLVDPVLAGVAVLGGQYYAAVTAAVVQNAFCCGLCIRTICRWVYVHIHLHHSTTCTVHKTLPLRGDTTYL